MGRFFISACNPTFSKVVLGGYRIEKTELKFTINGETVCADVAETTTEEFCKTFILKAPVTPEALRFEFQGEEPEIYEIEVLK